LIVAVTDLLPSIVTVHDGPVPVHAPLQPANPPLPLVVTVRVTDFTVLANEPVHVLPQLIPAGVLVIVPRVAALPLRATVSWFAVPVGVPAAIVNGKVPLAVPEGVTTETWAVPAAAMSVLGMAAVTWALLTNVVVRGAPFQRTVEPETKPLPLTVSVNAGPPAVALFGDIEVSAGAPAGGGGGSLAVPPSFTMLPTDGTPLAFRMNSM